MFISPLPVPLRGIAGVVRRRRGQGVTGHRHAALVLDHAYQDRVREASQLASEVMVLIETIGDPTLTVGLSFAPIYARSRCRVSDVLRWSQTVIDLADWYPSKLDF